MHPVHEVYNCLIYDGRAEDLPGFRFSSQYLGGNDFSGGLAAHLSTDTSGSVGQGRQ